jgi:hypothetical protein
MEAEEQGGLLNICTQCNLAMLSEDMAHHAEHGSSSRRRVSVKLRRVTELLAANEAMREELDMYHQFEGLNKEAVTLPYFAGDDGDGDDE